MSLPTAERTQEKSVLVTGASGFIGGFVCRQFQAAGYRVRATVRRGRRMEETGIESVEIAGLDDTASLRQAVHGVAAVVHLAGRAHMLREHAADPDAAFRRVNRDGATRMFEAAVDGGVRTFVFMSSVAAAGTGGEAVLTENMVPAPDTPYGRSKLEAEIALESLAEGTGVRLVALRPPMVYGPGMKGNPLRLFRLISSGLPIPVPAIQNQRSLIYVENLAEAIVGAVETPAAEGIFFVSDGTELSTEEMVRQAARALGRRPMIARVSRRFMGVIGRVGDILSSVVHVPVNSNSVDRFYGSQVVDSTRFTQLIGFSPGITMEEGFDRTARWYRHRRSE